jgi:hypothetical protein
LNEKSWQQYLNSVRSNGAWAGEMEILNLAEALNIYIFVHTDRGKLYTYPEIEYGKNKRTIHIW